MFLAKRRELSTRCEPASAHRRPGDEGRESLQRPFLLSPSFPPFSADLSYEGHKPQIQIKRALTDWKGLGERRKRKRCRMEGLFLGGRGLTLASIFSVGWPGKRTSLSLSSSLSGLSSFSSSSSLADQNASHNFPSRSIFKVWRRKGWGPDIYGLWLAEGEGGRIGWPFSFRRHAIPFSPRLRILRARIAAARKSGGASAAAPQVP